MTKELFARIRALTRRNINSNGETFELVSGDDALHSDETVTVQSGIINISTSYEGIEGQKVYVNCGEIALVSKDDGINASGGNDSSGFGGGRDAMFGGHTSSGGDGIIEINGGTFISTGSTTMMAQSFGSSSAQGFIACTTGNQTAVSNIKVQDKDGNTIISYEAEYDCVLVIISSADIVKGESYTLTAGTAMGSVAAEKAV